MNEQRFFDAALQHIRNQGCPSIRANQTSDEESFCLYSGPNGIGCAFAPAIMRHDPAMEGEPAGDYPKENLHEWARDLDARLICCVQSAHDSAARLTGELFLSKFNASMKAAAIEFNADNATNILVDELFYEEEVA